MRLGNNLVELLALNGGDLELERAGLARAIGSGKGASTPGASTVNLRQVGQLAEGLGVTQRHVANSVMGKGRD